MNEQRLILSNFMPYRLSVLSNRISAGIAALYEDQFQIDTPQWRVMAILGDESDLSAGQVAERTAMDKVAVSRAVKKLMDAGRIKRHFAADDRRRSVLALSNKGKNTYQEIHPIALAYEKALLEKLDKTECDQLDKLLTKLSDIQDNVGK